MPVGVFTDPRDWTDGEFVNEAIMDAHIKGNFNAMGPHFLSQKSADESVASNITPQNDDHLVTPQLAANTRWLLRWELYYTAVSASAGIRLAWAFPTSAGLGASFLWFNASSVVTAFAIVGTSIPTTALQLGVLAAGTDINVLAFDMHVAVAGTAGTVQLQWAQTTSNATATVMKLGSSLWGVQMA